MAFIRPARFPDDLPELRTLLREYASTLEDDPAFRSFEDELADPGAWATQYESAKSQARHTAATRAVEQAYAGLEAVSD